MPACQLCNQSAKGDHFPIDGKRAYTKDDPLTDERPLLLNPFFDSYEEHIEFLTSTFQISPGVQCEKCYPPQPGGAKAKTIAGETSIIVMEIYREPIRLRRLAEMDNARLEIKKAYNELGETGNWDDFARQIIKILSVARPFRTAVYYEIREYLTARRYWDDDDVKKAFAELGFKSG